MAFAKFILYLIFTITAGNTVLGFFDLSTPSNQFMLFVVAGLMLRTVLMHLPRDSYSFYYLLLGAIGVFYCDRLAAPDFTKVLLLISVAIVVVIDIGFLFKTKYDRAKPLTLLEAGSIVAAWIVAAGAIHHLPDNGQEISWVLTILISRSMLYGIIAKGRASLIPTAAGLEIALGLALIGLIPYIGQFIVLVATIAAICWLLLDAMKWALPASLTSFVERESPFHE